MILETRILCPRSWRMLFLFSEYKIQFQHKTITLDNEVKNNIKTPQIDQKSDFFYLFSNLKTFINIEELGNFGSFLDLIDIELINNIILPIREERVLKPLIKRSMPNTCTLQKKKNDLTSFLQKINNRLKKHTWIENNQFSYYDIALSTAIATLDYLGEIQWIDETKELYEWYIKIKSKSTFKIILNENCPGLKPFPSFFNLDF